MISRQPKVGLAFYHPGYSRLATCPTKVGEYLASGLPVVINSGIGDMERIIQDSQVGVVISDFSEAAYKRALIFLEAPLDDWELPARCRKVAMEHFSLEKGVEAYWQIYRKIAL